LQLQEELQYRTLSETSAGKMLVGEMQELKRKHEEEMRQLKAELQASGTSKDEIAALKEYYNKEIEGLRLVTTELEKLRDEDLRVYQEKLDRLQAKLDEKSGRCVIC
jgi:uncharacterized protein YydD (DUF2326 family)